MTYILKPTSQFRKDLKRLQKQHRDLLLLETVLEMLRDGVPLPPQYRDHPLTGNMKGKRECHIQTDWLLVYEYDQDTVYIYLMRSGSHAELFGL